jgi:hypothetical protein
MYRSKIAVFILIIVLTGTLAYAAPGNILSVYNNGDYELEEIINIGEEQEVIFENETFIYSFRDSRDVLAIHDKRNNYTWKSGLDIPSGADVKSALRKDEPLGYEPIEARLNQIFTSIANSLVTIEYYDDSNNIKRIGSAGEDTESTLMKVKGESNHFVLLVELGEIDLKMRVHLLITDKGYDINIYHEEFEGEGKQILAAVLLNPFMGASGGVHQIYNPEEGKHGPKVPKPEIPGYVLVPDGSGALIRFTDYDVSLKRYEGSVYGKNLSKEVYNYAVNWESFVPFKEPLVPLYGIAHESNDAAFLGYATEGDTHMEIIVVPEENTTYYTWAYPRFEYNTVYYQVFNKRGDGYFTTFEEPDAFNVEFSYEFLAGNGDKGPSADYVGMALAYREHLIETGQLTPGQQEEGNISTRIDFIMSDQKKSVIGYENVITTTVDDVAGIIEELLGNNDYDLSVGLYGWQDGGITSAHPWKADYIGTIGTKSEFSSLFSYMNDLGIDISFATDYVNINDEQVKLSGIAAKHVNKWYLMNEVWMDVPFTSLHYAKPEISAKWLEEQFNKVMKSTPGSHTIEGMSSLLLSEHGRNPMTEEEAVALYKTLLARLSEVTELNLKAPNKYLWQYTDRFLQAPVYHTQFLIVSEAVPFLQLVLNGTMDVFGPYSNFSFFSEGDILHMIDFNVYPSFILTKEGSYLLSTTNSQNFYSTEYKQYRDVIKNIYNKVNGALGAVKGADWIDRKTPEPGIAINTYSNGVMIVINHSENDYVYGDMVIEAMSYKVVR